MTANHFDIVINGGGLIGNSLALALSNTAYSIAVIEPYPSHDTQRSVLESRTIAISQGAKRIYEGLGVWADLAAYVTPIQHIHVSDRGHFGITRIHAHDQQLAALGYVLQIAEVNRVLQTKMQQRSTIKTYCPAAIQSAVLQENQQWHITLQSGEMLSSRLLIAADGAQSQLRQQLGLSLEEKDYQQTALVTVVALSRAHDNTAYERFTAEGPLALLPLQKNMCAVVLTLQHVAALEWQALSEAAFLQNLQRMFGYRLGRFISIGKRVAYPLKLSAATQQTLPQFLLMGNAAHTLHPIAAQSFNLSLRDVAVLAELLQQASQNNQTCDDSALIQKYLAERQKDQQRTIHFTDNLIELFAAPRLSLPRNLAMTALEILPPLKTVLGKYGAGTLGKLSRLGRGLSL